MYKVSFASIVFIFTMLVASGQTLEDFNLVNVVDGKTVSLKNYSSTEGLIIIFTVNDCPFDDYYISRIKTLNTSKIPVLLVNSHPDEAESVENMKKRATKIGINMPYLADKEQVLMQRLGAHKSTEAYLLKNNNGKFTVFYRGAIDDNPQVSADVRHAYLHNAIDKMLSGQAIDNTVVRPTGCSIKKR